MSLSTKAKSWKGSSPVGEWLVYDPDTGFFTWKIQSGRQLAGSRAGAFSKNGYLHIGIEKSDYLGHRLAVLYMTGEMPKGDVDHADGNPRNNRWVNLRQCERSFNLANARTRKNRKEGLKGTCYVESEGRWQANIHYKGRRYSLGRFLTTEEAHAAYCAKAKELFGEFANDGRGPI